MPRGYTTVGIEIDKNGKVEVTPLKLSGHAEQELANNMVVFFTGIQRESSDILSQQNNDTKHGDAGVI